MSVSLTITGGSDSLYCGFGRALITSFCLLAESYETINHCHYLE